MRSLFSCVCNCRDATLRPFAICLTEEPSTKQGPPITACDRGGGECSSSHVRTSNIYRQTPRLSPAAKRNLLFADFWWFARTMFCSQ